jgi:osmoprotectant transport system permease protein
VDAVLVGVRLLLTPWMPRGTRKARPAEDRPEPAELVLEDAAR